MVSIKYKFIKSSCYLATKLSLPCLLLFIFIISGCQHQPGNNNKNENVDQSDQLAFMYFPQEEFDAGKIVQGEKVAHSFAVENRGKSDLIIVSVTASCGCTIVNWDKKPIPSGKSGMVDVIFDSKGKFGMQHKTITVESNAKPDSKILSLKCEVVLPNNSKIE